MTVNSIWLNVYFVFVKQTQLFLQLHISGLRILYPSLINNNTHFFIIHLGQDSLLWEVPLLQDTALEFFISPLLTPLLVLISSARPQHEKQGKTWRRIDGLRLSPPFQVPWGTRPFPSRASRWQRTPLRHLNTVLQSTWTPDPQT